MIYKGLLDVDGALKWIRARKVVVQGEKHQRSLAIRTEETGHVSKFPGGGDSQINITGIIVEIVE